MLQQDVSMEALLQYITRELYYSAAKFETVKQQVTAASQKLQKIWQRRSVSFFTDPAVFADEIRAFTDPSSEKTWSTRCIFRGIMSFAAFHSFPKNGANSRYYHLVDQLLQKTVVDMDMWTQLVLKAWNAVPGTFVDKMSLYTDVSSSMYYAVNVLQDDIPSGSTCPEVFSALHSALLRLGMENPTFDFPSFNSAIVNQENAIIGRAQQVIEDFEERMLGVQSPDRASPASSNPASASSASATPASASSASASPASASSASASSAGARSAKSNISSPSDSASPEDIAALLRRSSGLQTQRVRPVSMYERAAENAVKQFREYLSTSSNVVRTLLETRVNGLLTQFQNLYLGLFGYDPLMRSSLTEGFQNEGSEWYRSLTAREYFSDFLEFRATRTQIQIGQNRNTQKLVQIMSKYRLAVEHKTVIASEFNLETYNLKSTARKDKVLIELGPGKPQGENRPGIEDIIRLINEWIAWQDDQFGEDYDKTITVGDETESIGALVRYLCHISQVLYTIKGAEFIRALIPILRTSRNIDNSEDLGKVVDEAVAVMQNGVVNRKVSIREFADYIDSHYNNDSLPPMAITAQFDESATESDGFQIQTQVAAVQQIQAVGAAVQDIGAEDAAVQQIDPKNAAVQDIEAEDSAVQEINTEDAAVQKIEPEDAVVQNIGAEESTVQEIDTEDAAVNEIDTENAAVQEIEAEDNSVQATDTQGTFVQSTDAQEAILQQLDVQMSPDHSTAVQQLSGQSKLADSVGALLDDMKQMFNDDENDNGDDSWSD